MQSFQSLPNQGECHLWKLGAGIAATMKFVAYCCGSVVDVLLYVICPIWLFKSWESTI